MEIRKFKEELFAKGKTAGFQDMEIYVTKTRELSMQVFQGEIDNYSLSEVQGIGFRGVYNEKMGYAYTEIPDQESIDLLLEKAQANAEVIDSTDEVEIYAGSSKYPEVTAFNPEFSQVDVENKISFIKSLEEEALKLDPRIKTANYVIYMDEETEVYLANTKGLERSFQVNNGGSYISVLAKDKEQAKTAGRYVMGNDWAQFNAKELASQAVEEALSLLDADTIESDSYPIILRNDVAGDILKTFASVFSAEAVQKGLSLLAGKLGQKIADSKVTLLDDPLLKNGAGSAPFDAEGVATYTKEVISEGVLSTFLYNLKTAKKDGVNSTGNAHKASFKSPVGIAPSNLYIKEGDKSFDQLVAGVTEGLVIIDVQGMHSGANPVSGDFSLGAYGYYVKDGKIKRPVDQITIAGNFFDLLQNVVAIGNDLKFGLGGPNGNVGSPSLHIKSLDVAGK